MIFLHCCFQQFFLPNLVFCYMKISRFFQILVPKDKLFYPFFTELANIIKSASECLYKLIETYPENSIKLIAEIKDLEFKADAVNHQVMSYLGKTFITPFDREDVQKLAHELDDVIDFMNSAGQKILLYKPANDLYKYLGFAELIEGAATEIKTIIDNLPSLGETGIIEISCIKIHDIENKMDSLFDETISVLFQNEKNAVELVKYKEIIETLEKVADSTERVSEIVKSIMIKFS